MWMHISLVQTVVCDECLPSTSTSIPCHFNLLHADCGQSCFFFRWVAVLPHPSATLRQIATHLVQACCIGSAAVARVIKYVYACLCLVCLLWSGTTRIRNQPWLFFSHFFHLQKIDVYVIKCFRFFWVFKHWPRAVVWNAIQLKNIVSWLANIQKLLCEHSAAIW